MDASAESRSASVHDARIVRVEWGRFVGRRPRAAGSNARLGAHGDVVRLPLVRLTADNGVTGFGAGEPSPELATRLLGVRVDDVFAPSHGVRAPWLPVEYAVWDLVGKQAGQPVYALAAGIVGRPVAHPYHVPCYDTSLYFDDLYLDSEREAAALIAAEAREGYARGQRAFKIKVGRGARHLAIKDGTRRDIAVIQAVREAVGPACAVMMDANNGYTLNLAKRVLAATAACNLYWIEEAFHEDDILYQDLRRWLERQGLRVLIADGEGDASPRLLKWARRGVIDIVQYDIMGHGLTRWLETGRQLDAWGNRSAPHHYGTWYGNYAACHLAAAIGGFEYVEWDEASMPGVEARGYRVADGHVAVPDAPGFGLILDEEAFLHAVGAGGFTRALP